MSRRSRTTRPPCAIAYLRVSTEEQATSGLGLGAQRTSCEQAAERLTLPLAQIFTDEGISGALTIDDRPALRAAVDTLRRGDVLLVAKRDRLGRNVFNVITITRLVQKAGARIVSAAGEGTDDDGPTGKLMQGLIDQFAEYERALISARTRAALHEKRQRGERVSGAVPYGFQVITDPHDPRYRVSSKGRPDPNGHPRPPLPCALEPRADEQQVIALLRQLRADGRTLDDIADTLTAQGYRMRSGTPWTHQRVSVLARGVQRGTAAAATVAA